MNKKNKKAIIWDELGLWIIALFALAIIIIGVFILKAKGINLIDKLRELLRFGR